MSGFNDLSHAEAERLALLLEEMGEAQQAIGKILRHGYESVNPVMSGPTNRRALEREVGDVLAALDLLVDAGDLDRKEIERFRRGKHQRVAKYLHHQKRARRTSHERAQEAEGDLSAHVPEVWLADGDGLAVPKSEL